MHRSEFCFKDQLIKCKNRNIESLKFRRVETTNFPNEIYWFLDSYFEKLSHSFQSNISSQILNSEMETFLKVSQMGNQNCPKSHLVDSTLEKLANKCNFEKIMRTGQRMNSEVLFCKNFSIGRLSYFLHGLTGFSKDVLQNPKIILLWLKILIKMVVRLQQQKKILISKNKLLKSRRFEPRLDDFSVELFKLNEISTAISRFHLDHLNFFDDLELRHKKFKREMDHLKQNLETKIKLGKKNFSKFKTFEFLDRQFQQNSSSKIETSPITKIPKQKLNKNLSKTQKVPLTVKLEKDHLQPKTPKNKKIGLRNASVSSKNHRKKKSNKILKNRKSNIRRRKFSSPNLEEWTSEQNSPQVLPKKQPLKTNPTRVWNSNKPIFCWDGDFNLQIVAEHLTLYISELFSTKLHSNAKVIREIFIKKFTMFKRKPNLVAFTLKFGPKFKFLVESAWENGSPSKYFKFKVDLAEKAQIFLWNEFEERDQERTIASFDKTPGRFNISQAKYVFELQKMSVESLNKKIIQKICERTKR